MAKGIFHINAIFSITSQDFMDLFLLKWLPQCTVYGNTKESSVGLHCAYLINKTSNQCTKMKVVSFLVSFVNDFWPECHETWQKQYQDPVLHCPITAAIIS